ncbi:MAG TPA: YCF48-related protein [Saprospiraceae bacterium]|nr:YCF48-related protein [Saprospiraceae bacterium]
MKAFFLLFMACLSYQIGAQSWIRQNPFPKLAELQDIAMDGDYGLVIGDQGTIFTTIDGGFTWVPRESPVPDGFFQAACIVPNSSGQTLYAGGYDLITSKDGGESWQLSNEEVSLIYKIQYLASGIIIVLDQDFGLKSVDGGQSWEKILMPGTNISAGHFTSEMNGWVQYGGFNNNQVWVTENGGDSWNLRDTIKFPIISEIYMQNDLSGFLASRDYVYKTIDGGLNWIAMHTEPANSILDMHVVNSNEIWTSENNGFIFYTLNGGTDWFNINPNILNSNRANAIFATDQGKVWVPGKYVSISYTDDFGSFWWDQIPNLKSTLFQPSFLNEEVGIIAGSNGGLLKTTNGGATWNRIFFPANEHFFSVTLLDSQTIMAGSSTGKLWLSFDDGSNWGPFSLDFGSISDFYAYDYSKVVLTSESGKIYRMTNGGFNLDEVYNDPSVVFTGIDFPTETLGWACGYNGHILVTNNEGMTWDLQYADGYNQFEDVHFTSPDEGWVVSSSYTDTIWHTADGGENWMSSILPVSSFWHSVSFNDPDTGWVVGGGAGFGVILRTNNGGDTWILDHESPEGLFGVFAVKGKETAWACGAGGNIVKYSPCTFQPELTALTGDEMPCEKDTVTYTVQFSDVDIFEWTFPDDWLVLGNPNTSTIDLIVGTSQGEVAVAGKDACGNEATTLSMQVSAQAVPEVFITEVSGTLECNLSGTFYQWYLDGMILPGANDQTYIPVVNGDYFVIVTIPATGCKISSNSLQFIVSHTQDPNISSLILSPNPAMDELHFRFEPVGLQTEPLSIAFFDVTGQCSKMINTSEHLISLDNLLPGLYIVVVKTKLGTWHGRIVHH